MKNTSPVTLQSKEAILIYSDPNGNGEQAFEETDTLAPGQTGWSKQYRDRPSFVARGSLLCNGVWRTAQTARSISWAQTDGSFASVPYSCQHTTFVPCKRWPANGTFDYYVDPIIQVMPAGAGAVDVTPDVTYMFGKFNALAAPVPTFNQTNVFIAAEVYLTVENDPDWFAATWTYDNDGDYDYEEADIRLSTAYDWANHATDRETLCHEFDHMMGLLHVWDHGSDGIDNVGSKATCIGMGNATGPSIDDVQALGAVYSGALP